MANSGKLRANVTDVRGQRIKEAVDVVLRHRTLSEVNRAVLKPGPVTTITNLRGRPDGIYQLLIDPPSYQPVNQFVEVLSQGVTRLDIVCAVDPKKVSEARFPAFARLAADAKRTLDASDTVLGFEGKTGTSLLAALDPIRQAGFMNIMAKSAATVFSNGRSAASVLPEADRAPGRSVLRDRSAGATRGNQERSSGRPIRSRAESLASHSRRIQHGRQLQDAGSLWQPAADVLRPGQRLARRCRY